MKKILLLDDDLDILQLVESLFVMEGFEVKATSTCTGLVLLAESFQPDLIILDYRLSDGNGGDLCREFKAHPMLNDTPVVIFSAYVKPGFSFMDFGCDEFIAKPFDIDDLISVAKRLTGLEKMTA